MQATVSPRILIAGYYGRKNAGDEAILQGIMADLRSIAPEIELVVVSGNPEDTCRLHSVRVIDWKDIEGLIDEVKKCSLVLIGGGGLIQDYWGVDRSSFLTRRQGGISEYGSPILLANLLGKPSMLYAIGVGPLRTSEGRETTRQLLDLVNRTTVRDKDSRALLESIGCSVDRIPIVPDPAFHAPSIATAPELSRALSSLPHPLIGVALRYWQIDTELEKWQLQTARALDQVLDDLTGTVVFVPFHNSARILENDRKACLAVREQMRLAERAVLAPPSLDPLQCFFAMQHFDLVLGMRLHALISAVRGAVPCVGMNYDPKVKSFLDQANLGDYCLELSDIKADMLASRLLAAYRNRDQLRLDMVRYAAEMTEEKSISAQEALDLADNPPKSATGSPLLSELVLHQTQNLARIENQIEELQSDFEDAHNDLRTMLKERKAIQDHVIMLNNHLKGIRNRFEMTADQPEQADQLPADAIAGLEIARRRLSDLDGYVSEVEKKRREAEAAQKTMRQELESQFLALDQKLSEAEQKRRTAESAQQHLQQEFDKLQQSRGFRLLLAAWNIIWRLRDPKQQIVELRDVLGSWAASLQSRLVRLGKKIGSLLTSPPSSIMRGIYRKARNALRAVVSPDAAASDLLGFEKEIAKFEKFAASSDAPAVIAIFASTQLIESEGQRSTNLTLELSRRGYPTVFVYWRWHKHDVCPQNRLTEGILQIPYDVAVSHPGMLFRAFGGKEKIAIFEFPHPSFFKPLAEAQAAGWIILYDAVDDWAEFHRVGQATWYDEGFEKHIVGAADAVFAVNKNIANYIRSLGREWVDIIPNGVYPGVERIDQERHLEQGEITIGYFGYLAGAWFDWKLLEEVAQRQPSWRIYLIGYGGESKGLSLPGNICILGKKPRHQLASFAAQWDVAIVPFKPERLAAGADPIKTYEYLAMGLPVVVTGVFPPEGAERFVMRASGTDEFMAKVRQASAIGASERLQCVQFAKTCTWGKRLDSMLSVIRAGAQRVGEKRSLFEESR